MNNKPFPFEGKILDDGKCVCDFCGKKRKMGGFFEPLSPDPKIVCVDCIIRATAQEHGITLKEAKHRRERMFASSNLFTKLKVGEYFKMMGRKFLSLEESNAVLDKITNAWNNKFTTKQRKSFERLTDEELENKYNKVNVDFSGLPNVTKPKIGRNDPCPCGSNNKYKKCCGNN